MIILLKKKKKKVSNVNYNLVSILICFIIFDNEKHGNTSFPFPRN